MLRPERCEKCSSDELWCVSPMVELSFLEDAELVGAVDGISPIETYLCGPCGHTRWFMMSPPARTDYERGVRPFEGPERAVKCRWCGGKEHHLIARMHEHNASGEVVWPLTAAGGSFACTACDDCGQLEWYGLGTAHGGKVDHRCPRCEGTCAELPVFERVNFGVARYPVAIIADRPVGSFRVHACTKCGLCDWFALGIDREYVGTRVQIVRVRRGPTPRGPGGGPYR